MAEPTASIWEVVRLMLTDPGTDPSDTAQAHGFDIAEVAELLPLLADNLRVDFARAGLHDSHLPPSRPAPGESPADFVGRYLATINGSDGVQVDPYVTLGGPVGGNGTEPSPVAHHELPDSFGTGRGDAPATDPGPAAVTPDEGPPAPDGAPDDGPFEDAAGTDAPAPHVPHVEPAGDLSDSDFQFD